MSKAFSQYHLRLETKLTPSVQSQDFLRVTPQTEMDSLRVPFHSLPPPFYSLLTSLPILPFSPPLSLPSPRELG